LGTPLLSLEVAIIHYRIQGSIFVITVAAAIIRRNQHILLTRRRPDAHLPNLWEFPGGKVEAGESLKAALRRELQEELGIQIEVLDESYTTTHHYPAKSVELHFFDCTIIDGEPRAIEVAEFRWVKSSDLLSYDFPEADLELVNRLARPHPST
jgi:mutator protein MutT